MVYSYTDKEQSVASNGNILFDTDAIKTGCTITHTPGTATFSLVRPGYYYVTATATVTSTTPASVAALTLFNGSTEIAGATNSTTIEDADSVSEITINAIIPVKPSCCMVNNNVNLLVVNSGAAVTCSNATITITKIA